jgi:hypothetical protein
LNLAAANHGNAQDWVTRSSHSIPGAGKQNSYIIAGDRFHFQGHNSGTITCPEIMDGLAAVN